MKKGYCVNSTELFTLLFVYNYARFIQMTARKQKPAKHAVSQLIVYFYCVYLRCELLANASWLLKNETR